MKRLLTAAVAVPVALGGTFLLPAPWFFAGAALVLGWACLELVALARSWAPAAPLAALVPLALALAAFLASPLVSGAGAARWLLAAFSALPLLVGGVLLLGRTPVAETPGALAALGFGVPYIAVPLAALSQLQRQSPWLVVLLFLIVWSGDSVAFWVGSRWGRSRMAPTVSPNKSWEGAAAGLAAGLAVTAAWSLWHLERLDLSVLALGGLTAVAAQLGDLVESLLKRSARIKDSGWVLPGHGGVLDRIDALLFAAPLLWLGTLVLEMESLAAAGR